MVKISLIIPVYNVELYLVKCLNSCVDQDIAVDEFEIIIVNDGTKDNSLNIAREFELKYRNIKIYSQENQGLSAARNKGLSLAKGEYVWFIDSDDWIKRNCLRQLTELCYNNSLDALAISAANVIGENIENRTKFITNEIHCGKEILRKEVMTVCAPFTIYKTSFLLEHELFFKQGIFHEDSEFTPRAYYFLKRILFLDDVCYFVRQNPTSITRTPNPKKAFDCIIVAKSLSVFSENIDKNLKTQYNNLISLNLNNSLYNTFEMSDEKIKELNNFIHIHKYLFKHLLKSNRLKYILEGVLFFLFPTKTVLVYKTIRKLRL
jgi:glycosyltransferase involved in cell wall biosynthesis